MEWNDPNLTAECSDSSPWSSLVTGPETLRRQFFSSTQTVVSTHHTLTLTQSDWTICFGTTFATASTNKYKQYASKYMRQIETEMFVFCESTKLPNSKALGKTCVALMSRPYTSLSHRPSADSVHIFLQISLLDTPLSVLSAVILWYALKCLAMYWLFLYPL